MKKTILALLAFAMIIYGCGDAGFESNISQLFETDPVAVDISVPALVVGQLVPVTPETTVTTEEINITTAEFDDYVGDIKSFRINEIYYQMNGFDSNNQADLDVDLNISFGGGASQPLLQITIPDVQNNLGQDFLLYDKDNPGSVNASTIGNLEQALLNGTPFIIELVLVGRDVILQTTEEQFDFTFKFDVTAKVQLVD